MTEPALPRHFRGPAWVARAVELHERGLTNVEIGEKLRLSHAAVSAQLRRNRDRLKPREWITPLALAKEFGGAISPQSLLRWGEQARVESVVSSRRWRLHRPSVVAYIRKMLARPCTECGKAVNSIRERDTLCMVCWPKHFASGGEPELRSRWAELGERLRNG